MSLVGVALRPGEARTPARERAARNAVSDRPADFGLSLTDREIEVVTAVCQHGGSGPAAAALGISLQTLKNHLTSVFRKLGAVSIAQAVWMLGPSIDRASELMTLRLGAIRLADEAARLVERLDTLEATVRRFQPEAAARSAALIPTLRLGAIRLADEAARLVERLDVLVQEEAR